MIALLGASATALNTPLQARFDSMLKACTLEEKTIAFIDQSSHRQIFRGVAAAEQREAVRTAFSVCVCRV